MFKTPLGSVITAQRLQLSLPDAMILGFLIFLPFYFYHFRKERKGMRHFYICLLFMYVSSLVSLTISLRFPWVWQAGDISAAVSQIEWAPLGSPLRIWRNCGYMGSYREFIYIVGGNFIMLMPLGILVPLINRRFRLGRMIALAVSVSVSIELLQLIGNILGGSRTVEVADVLLNSTGCVLAYLLFSPVIRRLRK